MKKTAWFFGDSFTAGWALNFDYDIKLFNSYCAKLQYYEKMPEHCWDQPAYSRFKVYKEDYKFSIWPHLFANHYNLNYSNHGLNGGSNDEILSSIICELENINEGDIVFIGMTQPQRILIPNDRTPNSSPIASRPLIGTWANFFDKENPNNIPNIANHHKDFYSDTDKETIVNFLHDIVWKHQINYHNHFLQVFGNLQKFFIKKNIKCLIWDYTLWFEFETIDMWTNGSVNDGHWSPKGHKDFFNFIIQMFEEDIKIVTKEQLVKL